MLRKIHYIFKLPLRVGRELVEAGFRTVMAEADLSWRLLESGLRLASMADAHLSDCTFLASL